MEIHGVSGTNYANESTGNQGLSVDDFLKIMAAELQNQNPMGSEGSSGSNTDYISQLAQFTMLEQMSAVTDGLEMLSYMSQQQYSFGLIGKEVTIGQVDGNISGVVEKVKIENGYAILVIDNKEYNIASVVEVKNYLEEDSPGE